MWIQRRFAKYVKMQILSFPVSRFVVFPTCGKFPPDMCPYLTAYQHWSRPEPNVQPHPEIQDPNDGNDCWARISSALASAMWPGNYLEAERGVLSLADLGMINTTLDGQNLSSPFQVTLNISTDKYISTFPPFWLR
jgi:hypothetical protein